MFSQNRYIDGWPELRNASENGEVVTGPGEILVSDGTTGMVYALDTTGAVQGSWSAGVSQLRG